MLVSFGWDIVTHPPHSLAPSDYRLYNKLKELWGGQRFQNDEEVQDAVEKWLRGSGAEGIRRGYTKTGPYP